MVSLSNQEAVAKRLKKKQMSNEIVTDVVIIGGGPVRPVCRL